MSFNAFSLTLHLLVLLPFPGILYGLEHNFLFNSGFCKEKNRSSWNRSNLTFPSLPLLMDERFLGFNLQHERTSFSIIFCLSFAFSLWSSLSHEFLFYFYLYVAVDLQIFQTTLRRQRKDRLLMGTRQELKDQPQLLTRSLLMVFCLYYHFLTFSW